MGGRVTAVNETNLWASRPVGSPANGLEIRLERVLDAVNARGIDAMLVTSDESIAYLTGFRPHQLERFFGVLLSPRGGAVIVPKLDEGQVEAPGKLGRVSYGPESDGLPELARVLGHARTVGVEEDHLSYARARSLADRGFELIPAASAVMELRMQKADDEIERVRAACELVEAALIHTFELLHVGVAEDALNARVEGWLREHGAEEVHPLILFGENAANPHAQPGKRQLRRGDVVCADVSARLDGYWGDLTRCATAGPPSEWAQEAWLTVCDAQRKAIEQCRVGVPARDVDLAQRQIIEAASTLGACLHGAGHAIGLAIHEPPFLVPRTELPLAEGQVLTIEPGIYHPEFGGIRIEDDIVVRRSGPEILSQIPQELTEVGA
jgi:Xaa-Pro dipeptidase